MRSPWLQTCILLEDHIVHPSRSLGDGTLERRPMARLQVPGRRVGLVSGGPEVGRGRVRCCSDMKHNSVRGKWVDGLNNPLPQLHHGGGSEGSFGMDLWGQLGM